jgi:hypothetical protein
MFRVRKMKQSRPALFRGRHFESEIIITCVRWYLRFPLSLRNVEELMVERCLWFAKTSIAAMPSERGCGSAGRITASVQNKGTGARSRTAHLRLQNEKD